MNNNLNELIELKNYINYLIEMVLTENPYNLNAMGMKHVSDYNKPLPVSNLARQKILSMNKNKPNVIEHLLQRKGVDLKDLTNNNTYIKTIVPDINNNINKNQITPVQKNDKVPMAVIKNRTPESIKWSQEQSKRFQAGKDKVKAEQFKLLPGASEEKEKMYNMHIANKDKKGYDKDHINPLVTDDKIREKISDREYERNAMLSYKEKEDTKHPITKFFRNNNHPEINNFINSKNKYNKEIEQYEDVIKNDSKYLQSVYNKKSHESRGAKDAEEAIPEYLKHKTIKKV